MHGPFAEFALLLLICVLARAACVRLRQPVLVAYIIVGIALGHVGMQALSLATLVGLVTITAMLYAQPLYERLAPWLRVFECRHPQREAGGVPAGTLATDSIVIGLGR